MERVGGARTVRRHSRWRGSGEDSRRSRRAAQGRGAHGRPGRTSFGDADARSGGAGALDVVVVVCRRWCWCVWGTTVVGRHDLGG